MIRIIVVLLCFAQWTVSPAAAAIGAPSVSMTHLVLPTAEAPSEAEASKGYTAAALADSVDELPGWGKLDFKLYSGYASRCLSNCT